MKLTIILQLLSIKKVVMIMVILIIMIIDYRISHFE